MTTINPSNVRFLYIRNTGNMSKPPKITVAYTFNKETKEVQFQFSVRNNKDSWNRMMGREIALGRLISRPHKFEANANEPLTHQIMKNIQKLYNETIPGSVVEKAMSRMNKDVNSTFQR